MTAFDKFMRLLFFVAFVVDVLLGLICVFFAGWVQRTLQLPLEQEPVFLRMLGLFPTFVGYLYYLIFRDMKKYHALIQVTVVERFMYPVILSAELLFLLPNPSAILTISFIVMAVITLFLAIMQTVYLRRENLPVPLLN